jgi:hypothetical protein
MVTLASAPNRDKNEPHSNLRAKCHPAWRVGGGSRPRSGRRSEGPHAANTAHGVVERWSAAGGAQCHAVATSKRLVSGGIVGLLACCALTACSGPSSTNGTVTGTVVLSGNISPTVLALYTKVVAWKGHHEAGEAPIRQTNATVLYRGPGHMVGAYQLALSVGRYVLEVGTSPPAGDVTEKTVTVRAGMTVEKNLTALFHAPGSSGLTEAPLHLTALAVGPNGDLYIIDSQRDQVLERHADGSFTLVAGTGAQGFSGDGGPATEADLRLMASSGLAVGNGGLLYIGDSGNMRVRAVFPDGVISTLVGNGSAQSSLMGTPALATGLGPVSGLAFGRYGSLYIAAQDGVAQLSSHVQWVVGSLDPKSLPTCGVNCNPAGEADFVGVSSLAFDAAGDMFCSGGPGSYGVYETAVSGSLSYLGTFRGDGGPAALAEAPDGSVVMSYRGGVVRLAADGATTLINTLAGVLGTQPGGQPNVFIGGDGLAVGPDGTIYVDTNTGNTFTTVSAIIAIPPGEAGPKVLWES